MAIRKSKEKNLQFNGTLEEVKIKCKSALEAGGFKKIEQKKCSLDELLLPSDLLHLSKKGHDLYYTFIYPKIESAVRDLLRK